MAEEKEDTTYKMTEADFKEFEKEVYKWQKFFGLLNWEIQVDRICSDKYLAAQCSPDGEARYAVISLAEEWHKKPLEFEVRRSAFHEVCELLLWRLHEMSTGLYAKPVVASRIHEVIMTLENTVFEPTTKGVHHA